MIFLSVCVSALLFVVDRLVKVLWMVCKFELGYTKTSLDVYEAQISDFLLVFILFYTEWKNLRIFHNYLVLLKI